MFHDTDPDRRGSIGAALRESDADYFAPRAREELHAAAIATHDAAAAIHRLLAGKYAQLAEREGN